MTAKGTIKVRIPITVEVSIRDWADTYGCEPTAADVRRDVREYFDNACAQSPAVVDANLIVRTSF